MARTGGGGGGGGGGGRGGEDDRRHIFLGSKQKIIANLNRTTGGNWGAMLGVVFSLIITRSVHKVSLLYYFIFYSFCPFMYL